MTARARGSLLLASLLALGGAGLTWTGCGGAAPDQGPAADAMAPAPPAPIELAEEEPWDELPAPPPDSPTETLPVRPSAGPDQPRVTPSPSPDEPSSDAAQGFDLDAWLDSLPLQDVVFNAPESLHLHERTTVWLRLQPGQDTPQLQVGFEADHPRAEGELQSANTRLAPEMEASLVASGLLVTAESPLRQAVSRRDATEWRWSVEASEPGPHTMLLTLSAVPPGSSALRPVKTLERELLVIVRPVEQVVAVVKDNWEWMWTFLGAPVGGWAYARWRRRRKQAPQETPSEPG